MARYRHPKTKLYYDRGVLHAREHTALIDSIREAAKTSLPAFVEVGVLKARTSKCIAQVLCDVKRPAKFFGIDIDPKSKMCWDRLCDGYSRNDFKEIEYKFFLEPLTMSVVKQIGLFQCAWMFIDGDHSYEGVRADLFYAVRLVGSGGLLAMHDTGRFPGDVARAIHDFDLPRYGFETFSHVPADRRPRRGLTVYRRNNAGAGIS